VLLGLTQAGVSREESYKIVQRNAMKVWQNGQNFLSSLKSDREVTEKISSDELEGFFDLDYHTKHVNTVFQRVFGNN